VFPARYELNLYIPEDGRENFKSYIALIIWAMKWRRNVFPAKYEPGFYIPEDGR
jgi:hypothetical protein